MNDYLKNALDEIYGKKDNFIVIGLTGQTGSGCSTVAKILSTEQNNINHSLYHGNNPKTNEQRKQKIIYNYFKNNWDRFHIIKASSVITLLWALSYDNDCTDELLKFVLDEKIFEKHNDSLLEKLERSLKELEEKIINLKNVHEKIEKLVNEKKTEAIINFYTIEINTLNEEIKSTLGNDLYVALYQLFGENIRLSGKVYSNQELPGNFFILSKKIKDIIDIIRKVSTDKKTFIVIDALRNPLEALFFQKRYSAFYFIAVTCENSERKNRLINLNFTEEDIKSVDHNEFKDIPLNEIKGFTSQNIPACLQKADIYINNSDAPDEIGKFRNLANQLIKIVSLIKKTGLITPTLQEKCMQIAYTAKLNSGCISRQVGAVVTDSQYSVKSVGWNDTPHGQIPCNLRNRIDLVHGYDITAYSHYEKNNKEYIDKFMKNTNERIEKIPQGINYSYCFKDEYNALITNLALQEFANEKKIKIPRNQVHTRSLHAEENAFLQISKHGGVGLNNGILFTTASPCELCAKKSYQLGISKIYYIDPYPGISNEHILQVGENSPQMILFSGAIGQAFHKLYSPIIPYKDELSIYS